MDFNSEVSELYPWLFKKARKYCSSVHDIEDLVNETVYKVLSNKEKFEEGRALKPWCETIMQNTYFTEYNRKYLVQYVSMDNNEPLIHRFASDETAVYEIFEAIERCRKRSCCIDCVMMYADGYSYSEIGKMFNIPVGTVSRRISYGRELLRKELEI